GGGVGASEVALRRLEGPVAVAPEDTDLARRVIVGHGEVEVAVAVELLYDQVIRIGADGVTGKCIERAVPVSVQDNDQAPRGRVVGHGQIENAVAVEVSHGHRGGPLTGAVRHRRLKGAVAVS